MSITNGYTSLAEVRSHLGDTGSKLDSALLERAINSASRAIDRYCGRRFWADPELVTRTYRACDAQVLDVDDISTATGLVLKTDKTFDGSFATTWQTTDFQLEPLNAAFSGTAFSWYQIVAIGDKLFPSHPLRATVQLTAKFGWSEVPDQVAEACVLKAVSLFRRKDAPFGIAGVGDFGPVRITRVDADVIDLLSPYVLPAVA